MFPHKPATDPWNDWYHVMWHTYGTWLPGDPKGFRTRHHREHVDGDYKNPPPKGTYDKLFERSRSLMNRDPVHLTMPQRHRAVDECVKSFHKWQIDLRILSFDRIHGHGLIRVANHNPRPLRRPGEERVQRLHEARQHGSRWRPPHLRGGVDLFL